MSETQETQVVPTEVEEKRYTYQPVDENGRPLGGPQVVKYRTEEELRNGLVEQNTLLLRKLRQKTKNERLGIVETEEISTDMPRYTGPIEFTPRTLTNEEYAQIAHDLTNPETAVEASKTLLEASLGAPVDKVGETLRSLQEEVMASRAVAEVNAFMTETPEFYKCKENAETLVAYVSRYNLAPIKENFRFAFDKLNELDPPVLIARPVDTPKSVAPVIPEIPVETPVETVTLQASATRPDAFPVVGIGSGLTREVAGDGNPPPVTVGEDIVYDVIRDGKTVRLTGLAAINVMPGDEYGRRIRNERNFQKKVDALYAAEERRKRQAAGR